MILNSLKWYQTPGKDRIFRIRQKRIQVISSLLLSSTYSFCKFLHNDVVQNPLFYKVGFVVSVTFACYAYRYMDNQIEAQENAVAAASPTLQMRGYRDLVSESFTKSLTSWPLFILLAGTGVVISVTSYLLEFGMTLGPWEVLAVTVVMLVSVVANILATVVGIKYFMNDGTGDVMGYFKEVLGSAWSYLWILSLSTLVIFSGIILFIIPGLILSTYLMFALYTRVAESTTGLTALTRSTELVRGYWWAITLRMIVLTLAMVVAFFLVGFVLGFVAIIAGLSEETTDLVSLLAFEPIFGAVGSIICLYALTSLYRYLVAAKAGVVTESSSIRSWYIALAVFTPLLVAAVFALITVGFINEYDFINPEFEEQMRLELDASV